MLWKRAKPIAFFFTKYKAQKILLLELKTISGFIVKFEFKVTVHCDLCAKWTHCNMSQWYVGRLNYLLWWWVRGFIHDDCWWFVGNMFYFVELSLVIPVTPRWPTWASQNWVCTCEFIWEFVILRVVACAGILFCHINYRQALVEIKVCFWWCVLGYHRHHQRWIWDLTVFWWLHITMIYWYVHNVCIWVISVRKKDQYLFLLS